MDKTLEHVDRFIDYFVVVSASGNILQRFPEENVHGFELPLDIGLFAQPGAVTRRRISSNSSASVKSVSSIQSLKSHALTPPTFRVSVLTQEKGGLFYCANLTFCLNDEEGDSMKSICIVSRHNFFSAFRCCLSAIYICIIDNWAIPVEDMITYFLHDIPVPCHGSAAVRFSLGAPQKDSRIGMYHILHLPSERDLFPVHSDINTSAIFRSLDIHNGIRLVVAALTEQKILLISDQASHLNTVAHAVQALIYPFRFRYVFIPVLPAPLLDFVSAPTPFLMGILSSYQHLLPPELCSDVIIVNMDTNTVIIPPICADVMADGAPDTDTMRKLCSDVRTAVAPDVFNADLAFTDPELPYGPKDIDLALRRAFMMFFANMFTNYRQFLVFVRVHPDPVVLFHNVAFLSAAARRLTKGKRVLPSKALPLLSRLLETGCFTDFIDRYGSPFRKTDIWDYSVVSIGSVPSLSELRHRKNIAPEEIVDIQAPPSLMAIRSTFKNNFDGPRRSPSRINSDLSPLKQCKFPKLDFNRPGNYISSSSGLVKIFPGCDAVPTVVPDVDVVTPVSCIRRRTKLFTMEEEHQVISFGSFADGATSLETVATAPTEHLAKVAKISLSRTRSTTLSFIDGFNISEGMKKLQRCLGALFGCKGSTVADAYHDVMAVKRLLIGSSTVRHFFARSLSLTPESMFSRSISIEQLELLAQLCNFACQGAFTCEDAFAAELLLPSLEMFYSDEIGERSYLYTLTCDNLVWKVPAFWALAFEHTVEAELWLSYRTDDNLNHNTFAKCLQEWHDVREKEQLLCVENEEAIVLEQFRIFIRRLVWLQASDDDASRFIYDMSVITRISNAAIIAELHDLLHSTLLEHSASRHRLESLRQSSDYNGKSLTVSPPLLLPRETIILRQDDITLLQLSTSLTSAKGSIFLTNYRFIFNGFAGGVIGHVLIRSFPLSSIFIVKRLSSSIVESHQLIHKFGFEVWSSTCQIVYLYTSDADDADNLVSILKIHMHPTLLATTFVFQGSGGGSTKGPGSRRSSWGALPMPGVSGSNHTDDFLDFLTEMNKKRGGIPHVSKIRRSIDATASLDDNIASFGTIDRAMLLDFVRQGVISSVSVNVEENDYWRIVYGNAGFGICESYPRLCIIPASVNEADLILCAKFHRNNCFPTLAWYHPVTKAALLRSSRPILARGTGHARCLEDERFMVAAGEATAKSALHAQVVANSVVSINGVDVANDEQSASLQRVFIVTTPPSISSGRGGNMFRRYNTHEFRKQHMARASALYPMCEIIYLDGAPFVDSTSKFEDSHAMIHWGFVKLMAICCGEDNPGFLSALSATGWLGMVGNILDAATLVTEILDVQGNTAVVSLDYGADATSQITTLAMIMLDPHYRTLDGFMMLCEQQWVAMGHRFGSRGGFIKPESSAVEEATEAAISPGTFLIFLDAVWQIMQQFPMSFQFNGYLLSFIGYHVNSCCFGNFLVDNERLRIEQNVMARSQNLWDHISKLHEQSPVFYNFYYQADATMVLRPRINMVILKLWPFYHCNDTLAIQIEMEGVMDTVATLRAHHMALQGRRTSISEQLNKRDSVLKMLEDIMDGGGEDSERSREHDVFADGVHEGHPFLALMHLLEAHVTFSTACRSSNGTLASWKDVWLSHANNTAALCDKKSLDDAAAALNNDDVAILQTEVKEFIAADGVLCSILGSGHIELHHVVHPLLHMGLLGRIPSVFSEKLHRYSPRSSGGRCRHCRLSLNSQAVVCTDCSVSVHIRCMSFIRPQCMVAPARSSRKSRRLRGYSDRTMETVPSYDENNNFGDEGILKAQDSSCSSNSIIALSKGDSSESFNSPDNSRTLSSQQSSLRTTTEIDEQGLSTNDSESMGASLGEDLKPVTSIVPSSPVRSREGYIFKLGGKLKNRWQRRWFVLDRFKFELFYYEDEECHKLKGSVPLHTISKVTRSNDPMVITPLGTLWYYFYVHCNRKIYHLRVNSSDERSAWMDSILLAMKRRKSLTLSPNGSPMSERIRRSLKLYDKHSTTNSSCDSFLGHA